MSYFRLWYFRTKLANNHHIPVDSLLNAFHSLFPDTIQKEPEGRYVAALISRRPGAKVGRTAPDYTLRATTGRVISSQNTRGKYVLLDFWASWCGPCIAEMPKIEGVHKKYDTSKLLIVSITLDAHEKDFQEAAERLHMTWPLIFGDRTIENAYDVAAVPTLFLIDPEGRIIYKNLELDEKGIIANDDEQLSKLNEILSSRLGQH